MLDGRERELHLGFDPGGAEDPKPVRTIDRVFQQGGLADTAFAVEDQHAAARVARGLQQSVESLTLARAAEQLSTRRERK